MKILHIIPGSGGSFYCGNCLRDSKFVEALRQSDHQVVKLPMYLPLFADEHDLSGDIPVFYGAVSIYLKQVFPVFRHAPEWFDRMLNSKAMLKIASHYAGSTRAKGLEEMTVSMLLGEHGQQKDELERMVEWIAENCKPDIIHLSNALLLGLAERLTKRMNVPVVCSLQDEDVWVDVMKPRARERVWKLMEQGSEHIKSFISVSDYYFREMKTKMHIPEEKLEVVHIGVFPEDYEFSLPSSKPRNIGFVSRMCEENGMDILVDAFIDLKKKPGFEDVKLILTGGSTGDDKKFLKNVGKRIAQNGLEKYLEFHEDFEEEGLREFFKKVSVISVPVRKGEAFGIYLLESMASGIPVVQPALGAFPEIVNSSGGGKIYEPNEPSVLSQSLAELLSDSESLDRLALQARKGLEEHFHLNGQVKKMIKIYQSVLNKS
ncbi:MAG: glycosyltransferase family 4 protein [Bacteroidales bacterium]|nr:glycosyltransferase family 4 protein [Bacteroidales bacterium]MCB9012751.1 glycosyltransferase family 4 protein [Bacteroidales bacterium]